MNIDLTYTRNDTVLNGKTEPVVTTADSDSDLRSMGLNPEDFGPPKVISGNDSMRMPDAPPGSAAAIGDPDDIAELEEMGFDPKKYGPARELVIRDGAHLPGGLAELGYTVGQVDYAVSQVSNQRTRLDLFAYTNNLKGAIKDMERMGFPSRLEAERIHREIGIPQGMVDNIRKHGAEEMGELDAYRIAAAIVNTAGPDSYAYKMFANDPEFSADWVKHAPMFGELNAALDSVNASTPKILAKQFGGSVASMGNSVVTGIPAAASQAGRELRARPAGKMESELPLPEGVDASNPADPSAYIEMMGLNQMTQEKNALLAGVAADPSREAADAFLNRIDDAAQRAHEVGSALTYQPAARTGNEVIDDVARPVVQGLGSYLPSMGIGIMARGATWFPALIFGASEGADTFRANSAEGVDTVPNIFTSLGQTVLSAGAERFSLGSSFKSPGLRSLTGHSNTVRSSIGRVVGGALRSGASEAGAETLQTSLGIMATPFAKSISLGDPVKNIFTSLADNADQIFESAWGGFGAGAVGGGAVGRSGLEFANTFRYANFQKRLETVAPLADSIVNAKGDLDGTRTQIRNMLYDGKERGQTGLTVTAFADAGDIERFTQSMPEAEAEAFLESIGTNRATFEQAVENQVDIEVPTENILALPREDAKEIRALFRPTPSMETASFLRKQHSDIEGTFELAAKMQHSIEEDIDKGLVPKAIGVFYSDLRAIKGKSAAEARAETSLLWAWTRTQARRRGIDADKFASDANVRVALESMITNNPAWIVGALGRNQTAMEESDVTEPDEILGDESAGIESDAAQSVNPDPTLAEPAANIPERPDQQNPVDIPAGQEPGRDTADIVPSGRSGDGGQGGGIQAQEPQRSLFGAAEAPGRQSGRPLDSLNGLPYSLETTTTSGVKADPKLFQFKRSSDADTGVKQGQELPGDVDPAALGTMVFYEDVDGQRFVVSGHHRLDLLRRRGQDEELRAVILRENDGWTTDQARAYGAALNIKEGGGDVDDYATFFRETRVGADVAEAQGLLRRENAKLGYAIGSFGGDAVFFGYLNGEISERRAAAVAAAAPGDATLQEMMLTRKIPTAELQTFAGYARKLQNSGSLNLDGVQLSLFSSSDDMALLAAMEKESRAASKEAQRLDKQAAALEAMIRAGKTLTPAEMNRHGVRAGNKAGMKQRAAELRVEAEQWRNFFQNPDILAQVQDMAGTAPESFEQGDADGEMVIRHNLEGKTAPVVVVDTPGWTGKLPKLRKKAKRILNEFRAQQDSNSLNMRNTDTGWNVLLTSDGIGKTVYFKHTKAGFQALEKLPELVRNAVLIEETGDRKGRERVEGFAKLLAPVVVGEDMYAAEITVKKSMDGGHKFYLQRLQIVEPAGLKEDGQENPDVSFVGGRAAEAVGVPPAAGSAYSIQQLVDDVKSAAGEPESFEQSAYHGTPHQFGRFSLDAIGQGEGQQAEGWGVYFTDSRNYAEGYRERLRSRMHDFTVSGQNLRQSGMGDAAALLERFVSQQGGMENARGKLPAFIQDSLKSLNENEGAADAIMDRIAQQHPEQVAEARRRFAAGENMIAVVEDIFRSNPEIMDEMFDTAWRLIDSKPLAALRKLPGTDITVSKPAGQVLQAGIPDSNVLLNRDASLKEQPPVVRGAFASIEGEYGINLDDIVTGADGYSALADVAQEHDFYGFATENPNEAASRLLNQYGVKGMQYAGNDIGGEGATNFIVFDEHAIEIIERNHQNNSTGVPDSFDQSAYHGTPHRFDRFSTNAIGTGEGAQAYGWGLYFAENREISEIYREGLSTREYYDGDRKLSGNEAWAASFLLDENGKKGTIESAAAFAANTVKADKYPEILNLIVGLADKDLSVREGQVYKVEIPENDVLLDWDKPMSEQPQKVQDALMRFTESSAVNAWKENGTWEHALGKNLYSVLTSMYRSDKTASLKLKELGIQGIRYLDGNSRARGEGTHNFVVFDDKAVNVIETYYQNQPAEKVRARVELYTATPEHRQAAVIRIMGRADRSTVPHELAHVFLDDMTKYVMSGNADNATRRDYAMLVRWAGGALSLDPNLTKGTAEYKQARKVVVENVERVARGFEQYLAEGRAPSLELVNSFDMFKKWLNRVYKNIRQYVAHDMDPKVRGVYDRWLASDEQIREAEVYYNGRNGNAFINFLDDEEKRQRLAEQLERNRARVTSRFAGDMVSSWMEVHADEEQVREIAGRQVEGETVYRAIAAAREQKMSRADAEALVGKQVVLDIVAKHGSLFTGKDLEDSDVSAILKKADYFEKQPLGLFLEELANAETVAEAVQKHGSQGRRRRYYQAAEAIRKAGGMDIDVAIETVGEDVVNQIIERHGGELFAAPHGRIESMAAELGFKGADDMLAAMAKADNEADRLEDLFESRMRERAREARKWATDQVENLGDAGWHNPNDDIQAESIDITRQAIWQGLKARERRRQDYIERRVITDRARADLAQLDMRRSANYAKWAAAERFHAKNAAEAAARGDGELALEALNKQQYFHAMVTESFAIRQERQKFINRYSYRMARSDLSTVEYAYREVVKDILNFYRIIKSRAFEPEVSLPDELNLPKETDGLLVGERSVDEDIDVFLPPLETIIPAWLKTKRKPNNYTGLNDLTVEQMRDIDNTIQLLMNRGRGELNALHTEQAATIGRQKQVILDTLDKLPDYIPSDSRSWLNRKKKNVESYLVSNLMIDRIAAEIDGNPMLKGQEIGLFQTLVGKVRTKEVEQMEMLEKFQIESREDYGIIEGMAKRFRKEFGGKTFNVDGAPMPEIIRDVKNITTWDADMILQVFFNMGNAGNRFALQQGLELSDAALGRLASLATAEEWRAVERIGKRLEQFHPMLDDVYFRMTNKHLPKVQPVPFTVETWDNEVLTLAGWYFPLKYDPELNERAAQNQEAADFLATMNAIYNPTKLQDGFTKGRAVDENGEPVVARPPQLKTSVLVGHLQNMTRWATHAEALYEFRKLTMDSEVKDAITKKLGAEKYRYIREWTNRMTRPDKDSQSGVNRIFGHLRSLSTVAALGWNMKSALRQNESFGIAADMMSNASRTKSSGWYWMAQGMKKVGGGGFFGAWVFHEAQAHREMYELSPEARMRAKDVNKEFRDMVGATDPTRGGGVKVGRRRLTRDIFFHFTLAMDKGVSSVVWWGAYQQAMNGDAGFDTNGLTDEQIREKSVQYADTILRSQQSPFSADYTKVQADGGAISLFTQFMGGVTPYLSHTYGMGQMWRRGEKSTGAMLRHLINVYTMPVLVTAMIKRALFGWDDDEESLASEMAWGILNGLTSPLPIVRDVVGIAQYGERSASIPAIQTPARSGIRAYKGAVKLADGDVAAAAADFGRAAAVVLPAMNPIRQVGQLAEGVGILERE